MGRLWKAFLRHSVRFSLHGPPWAGQRVRRISAGSLSGTVSFVAEDPDQDRLRFDSARVSQRCEGRRLQIGWSPKGAPGGPNAVDIESRVSFTGKGVRKSNLYVFINS